MKNYETPTTSDLRAQFDAIELPPYRGGHLTQKEENRTRMERALSWLERYEKCGANEIDEQFLFLWISFNAAYGADEHLKFRKLDDHKKFEEFLGMVVDHDDNYERLSNFLRVHEKNLNEIMKNRFLFDDFWRAEYSEKNSRNWQRYFAETKNSMKDALRKVCSGTGIRFHFVTVLGFAFDRLYTLRNQMIHGHASWRDRYNRTSLDVGNAVLGSCIPVILEIMLIAIKKDPDMSWGGRVAYPPFLPVPDDKTNLKPPQRDKQRKNK